jgi:WD40 repeat protein
MERNKIIAVAALAVGIVAWRMGAMQQNSENIITIKTSDGGIFQVPIEKARLFGMINLMMSEKFKEQQEKMITSQVNGVVLQEVLKDLDWVMQVRNQMRSNQTEQQAAKRIMKDMPAAPFDENKLELLMAQLVVADYLQQAALVERYARQIADMITSDASMKLLGGNDKEYGALITDLDPRLQTHVLHYMPRRGVCDEEYTAQHTNGQVVISVNGTRVVMGSDDKAAKILTWNGNTWIEYSYDNRDANYIRSLAISADGNTIVMGTDGGRLKNNNFIEIMGWKSRGGGEQWVGEGYMAQRDEGLRAVAMSANGDRMVTVDSEAERAKIWEWDGNKWDYHNNRGYPIEIYLYENTPISSVAISANGNKIVMGGLDGQIRIVGWGAAGWAAEYRSDAWDAQGASDKYARQILSVAISADGHRVVTGSRDSTVKIMGWNGNAWVEQHTIQYADSVGSVAISADGNRVVTGSDDKTAKIMAWNGTAWIEQYTIQHADLVGSVAISADGNRVVTGSWDKTAKIVAWNGNAWDVQYTIMHSLRVVSVGLSADGNSMVTGSYDGQVKISRYIRAILPGISDFDANLFERLLIWAKTNSQKISEEGWVAGILSHILWEEAEPVAERAIQKLIRESIAR